jgi:tetratricopeptide (TPR) repeat protein
MDEDAIYDLPPLEKARALLERARTERRQGRDAFAHAYCVQSLNLFRGHRDRPGEAAALLELADLALHHNPTGDNSFERRKRLCEEALAIYRTLGERRGTASALRLLASVVPHAEGIAMLEESLTLSREADDKRGIAASLDRLGSHAAFRDRPKARAHKEEALALHREIGNRSGEAVVLFGLAVSFMSEDPARSLTYAEESLAAYRDAGAKKGVAQMLQFIASTHPDDDIKIAYYTESRAICREIGVPIWEAGSLRRLADIAERHGDHDRARAIRAEADAIYLEQPADPEMLKAFHQALKERDSDAARDTAQRLFGEGGQKSRRSKQA